jgi:N-acetylglucosamine kinase
MHESFMGHFLGIDGGGTRTTACLSDEKGRILARIVTGPSNPLKVGVKPAQNEILRSARAVMRQARVNRIEAVCVGLAGTDRPQVHKPMLMAAQGAGPGTC